MDDNKRLEVATQVAAALVTNSDDTSTAGVQRVVQVSIAVADGLIAGTK